MIVDYLILILIGLFFYIVLRNKTVEPYDHFWDFDQSGCDIHSGPYIRPGVNAINNLSENLTTGLNCSFHSTSNKIGPCGCLEVPPSLKLSPPFKTTIQTLQPCILDKNKDDKVKPYLRDYYSSTYYYDDRYPERPISVNFAKGEDEYCDAHPNTYPCPIRYSRTNLK